MHAGFGFAGGYLGGLVVGAPGRNRYLGYAAEER